MIVKKKIISYVLIPFSLVIGLGLFLGRDYIRNYYEDNFSESFIPYGFTNCDSDCSANAIAKESVHEFPLYFVSYISDCKIIPIKIEDFFKSIDVQEPEACPKVLLMRKATLTTEELRSYPRRWIDPWGRPYQIRYDRERRKLQVRSQGRYLWTEFDDIVGETSMAIPIDMADAERAKCDSLPKDDMSCIFNRSWH